MPAILLSVKLKNQMDYFNLSFLFRLASLKQRSLRLTLWGNSFPGFCQSENEVNNGVIGVPLMG